MFAAAIVDAWPELEQPLLAALDAAGLRHIVDVSFEPHTDGTLTGRRFLTAPVPAENTHDTQAPPQGPSPATATDGLASEDAHRHTHRHNVTHDHDHDHDHELGHPDHPHEHTGSNDRAHSHGPHHAHRSYRTIAVWLDESPLSAPVKHHAHALFRALAEAEGQVHGIPADDVTFHEVGAWDSIADMVTAAWLIDAIGDVEWYSAPLPLGRGRVHTAHGELPIPAPATALLLEGFQMYQDGLEGERITPTGAAILKHLSPIFEPMGAAGMLTGTGTGFGTKRFPGISNILRVTRFEEPAASKTGGETTQRDTIGVCEFEVDDQSPEDLAEGLDAIRNVPGVLDVLQIPAMGKKGRMAAHVQVLAEPSALETTVEAVLVQTATLGVRWRLTSRTLLGRSLDTVDVNGNAMQVKRATRPDGMITSKAEHRDVSARAHSYAERRRLRAAAEETVHDGAGIDH